MKKIILEVTSEDKTEGRVNDCENCPLALAMNRLLKPEYQSYVNGAGLFVYRGKTYPINNDVPYLFLPHTKKTSGFMWKFDASKDPGILDEEFNIDRNKEYLFRKEVLHG